MELTQTAGCWIKFCTEFPYVLRKIYLAQITRYFSYMFLTVPGMCKVGLSCNSCKAQSFNSTDVAVRDRFGNHFRCQNKIKLVCSKPHASCRARNTFKNSSKHYCITFSLITKQPGRSECKMFFVQ